MHYVIPFLPCGNVLSWHKGIWGRALIVPVSMLFSCSLWLLHNNPFSPLVH